MTAPRASSKRTPAAGLPAAVACSVCARVYSLASWSELTMVDRIEPARVHGFMQAWPDDVCIEVRSCQSYGHAIPVKTPVARA